MNKLNHEKISRFCWAIAGLVTVISIMAVVFMLIIADNEEVRLDFAENYGEDVMWYVNTEPEEFPYKLKGVANSTIVLDGEVPEEVNDDWGMMIYAAYGRSMVYVDNELVYSFGFVDPLPHGRILGNVRLIIPLKQSMAGKKIIIHLQPRYTMSFDINRPEFGTMDQLKANVLLDNLFRLFVVAFATILFVTAFGILIIQLRHHRTEDVELSIHFISFMFLSMTWIVCSSDIPQFFSNAYAPVSFLSFLSLSALGVPFVGLCKVIFKKGKRLFELLWAVGLLVPLINIVAFMANIGDPMTLLPLTHIYLIVSVILSFIFVLLQRKDDASKTMVIGMLVIIISAAAGLALFYVAPTKGYAPSVFSAGFFIFFVIVIKLLWSRRIEQIKESKFIDTYRSLAYSDVMTGLENRTSFEARFSSMKSENMQGKMVTIVLFDITGIKEVNDSIGHQAGDKMITGTADIINRTFSSVGRCYRIGGDEFAVIMVDKPLLASKYLADFDMMVEEYNKYNVFAIKVAYGYAQREWRDDPTFFRDLFKEADKAMYSSKQSR